MTSTTETKPALPNIRVSQGKDVLFDEDYRRHIEWREAMLARERRDVLKLRAQIAELREQLAEIRRRIK